MRKAKLELLEALTQDVRGESTLGDIRSAELLAGILDRHIGSYLAALEEIERRVDAIDVLALHPRSTQDLVPKLLAARRSLAASRRQLTKHRDLYGALARPELVTIASSGLAERFGVLRDRFEQAVESFDSARERAERA